MEKKYDWKITAKKIGFSLLKVFIAGGLAVWANNPYFMMLVPILEGLENYLKHKWEIGF